LEQLVELVDAMATPLDFRTYRQLDSQFHLAVASASRSPRLIEAEREIQRDLSHALILGGEEPIALSLESSNEQHARICSAIAANDPVRARTEMESHVRGTADMLVGLRLGMLRERARG
jgi:DNA-binding GntR family transcriptional regulator